MLRMAVLVLGWTMLAAGAILGLVGCLFAGGIQLMVTGILFIVGTVFERWRYKNRNANSPGHWEVTDERFIDPETGRGMEVLYDPHTGERKYRELREAHNRVD